MRRLVTEHLGEDPSELPTYTEQFHVSEHANLQLALDALLADVSEWRLLGLPAELQHYGEFSLASMLGGRFHGSTEPCAPEFVNVPVDVDRTLPCVRLGVYLLTYSDVPLVAMVGLREGHGPRPGLFLDVVAADADHASRFVSRIRELMHQHNVYRGKVLSFSFTEWGDFGIAFHRLPAIGRDDIVLPDADIEAIERHTIGMSQHGDVLRAAGRHLKRGLLLYGPPGTGKTLSVMYLCGQMPGRTTLLLSGPGAGALGRAAAIARSLQPAMVVLEDVDLVAAERSMPGIGTNPLLFQLLNEMDGLAEDADVVFVLTTNRVDLLEPALAARPGRIDQAVEIRLPDSRLSPAAPGAVPAWHRPRRGTRRDRHPHRRNDGVVHQGACRPGRARSRRVTNHRRRRDASADPPSPRDSSRRSARPQPTRAQKLARRQPTPC